MAVASGRILGVGGVADRWIGPDTEVVDLDGRLLCPGFQDAHVHPATGGLLRLRCNLMPAASWEDAAGLLAGHVRDHPDEPWIRGGGWRFPWFAGGMPPATLLDEFVGDRPAYLRVADGHTGWANTAALRLAGIDAETPDPPDGRIERLADGRPQGTLQEGAMDLVERVMPQNTVDDLERGLLAGQEYLFGFGITAWQEADVDATLHEAYVRAASSGRLRAAVRGAQWYERTGSLDDQIAEFERRRNESVGAYRATAVKLMLDGVVENFTARVLEPYLDHAGAATNNRGIDFLDPAELGSIVTAVMRAGFQPHFHTLGDAAVRQALDAIEAAIGVVGPTDLRPHLAHLQLVHPDDVGRFRRLGVAANAQPLWACAESSMTELTLPFLTQASADHQYPFADLLAAGAVLAMGSDWSVSTPNVMEQVDVAVNRQVVHDRSVPAFLPEQRITVSDALVAFTAGSAFVNHDDDRSGTIAPGKAADLVVLGGNPFETETIASIPVDMTFVGGSLVYER